MKRNEVLAWIDCTKSSNTLWANNLRNDLVDTMLDEAIMSKVTNALDKYDRLIGYDDMVKPDQRSLAHVERWSEDKLFQFLKIHRSMAVDLLLVLNQQADVVRERRGLLSIDSPRHYVFRRCMKSFDQATYGIQSNIKEHDRLISRLKKVTQPA